MKATRGEMLEITRDDTYAVNENVVYRPTHRPKNHSCLGKGTVVLVLKDNRVLIDGQVYHDPYILFTQECDLPLQIIDHVRRLDDEEG